MTRDCDGVVMGCCGQARAALRATVRTTRAAPRTDLRLENLRGENLRVRGVVTGRIYVFTPDDRTQAVHPADADVLLRSGHFRPVR